MAIQLEVCKLENKRSEVGNYTSLKLIDSTESTVQLIKSFQSNNNLMILNAYVN